MGNEVDRRILQVLKRPVKRQLEREETGVFSKTEVMRTFRNVIRGSTEKRDAMALYEDGRISRRQFLKVLGFGVGGAAVASGIGWFMGQQIFDERRTLPTGYVTLDISEGEVIDDYLDTHLEDGAEVHIPEGEYQWDGYGLGGRYQDMSLIGDGNVVWNVGEKIWEAHFLSDGGTVMMKDITIRGQRGPISMDGNDADLSIAVRAEASDGHVIIDNVNQPDGSINGSDEIGHYLGRDHVGEVTIRNCHIEHFGNNGIYGEYYDGAGHMTVENCFLKNNNIDSIRFCGEDDIRNCVIVYDETPPESHGGGLSGRGIKSASPGDMSVTDTDIVMGAGQHAIVFQEGSGTLENVRVRNDISRSPIINRGGGTWTGDACIVGSGSRDAPGSIDVSSDCDGEVREAAPAAVSGSPSTSGTSGQSGNSGSSGQSSLC